MSLKVFIPGKLVSSKFVSTIHSPKEGAFSKGYILLSVLIIMLALGLTLTSSFQECSMHYQSWRSFRAWIVNN